MSTIQKWSYGPATYQDYYRSCIMEARYMEDYDCLRLQIKE